MSHSACVERVSKNQCAERCMQHGAGRTKSEVLGVSRSMWESTDGRAVLCRQAQGSWRQMPCVPREVCSCICMLFAVIGTKERTQICSPFPLSLFDVECSFSMLIYQSSFIVFECKRIAAPPVVAMPLCPSSWWPYLCASWLLCT